MNEWKVDVNLKKYKRVGWSTHCPRKGQCHPFTCPRQTLGITLTLLSFTSHPSQSSWFYLQDILLLIPSDPVTVPWMWQRVSCLRTFALAILGCLEHSPNIPISHTASSSNARAKMSSQWSLPSYLVKIIILTLAGCLDAPSLTLLFLWNSLPSNMLYNLPVHYFIAWFPQVILLGENQGRQGFSPVTSVPKTVLST